MIDEDHVPPVASINIVVIDLKVVSKAKMIGDFLLDNI